ncbi:hypothetical protein LINPERPRIM_LOCUS5884, partial [Linum perenne]
LCITSLPLLPICQPCRLRSWLIWRGRCRRLTCVVFPTSRTVYVSSCPPPSCRCIGLDRLHASPLSPPCKTCSHHLLASPSCRCIRFGSTPRGSFSSSIGVGFSIASGSSEVEIGVVSSSEASRRLISSP